MKQGESIKRAAKPGLAALEGKIDGDIDTAEATFPSKRQDDQFAACQTLELALGVCLTELVKSFVS